MRADACDRRSFLHCVAVFRVPSDSEVWRSRARRNSDRDVRGSNACAASRFSLLRAESTFAAEVNEADTAVEVLQRFCYWIAARMVSRPGLYRVLIVGGLGLTYANL